MSIGDLTGIIIWINALIDTGEFDDITLEAVKEHIVAGDILQYLENVGGAYSLLRPKAGLRDSVRGASAKI